MMKLRKQYIAFNANRLVTVNSDCPIDVCGETSKEIETNAEILVGKPVPHEFITMEDYLMKPQSELRIALICNWQTRCGISTYSKFLYDAIVEKVNEVGIFSECSEFITDEDGPNVFRCWKRGESLMPLAKKIENWNPDFIIVQHEFGIFPNLFYFMQFMQYISAVPYVVTMHSVFEHLDKIVYSDCIKNIVVHTQQGKDILLNYGHNSQIHVIPHGCPKPIEDATELWNICHNAYTVMQFGFGFQYKGVERALDAIHYLKTHDEKFSNIFYFYLLSENEHTKQSHDRYYDSLMNKIRDLGIDENIAINRKFQTEKMLSLYLRLAKLAIFPYVSTSNNTVYASSGAVRIAMAHNIPVIVSDAHLFDDLEGIVPRPCDGISLAKEIDEVFSNEEYRKGILSRSKDFLLANSWSSMGDRYLDIYKNIVI